MGCVGGREKEGLEMEKEQRDTPSLHHKFTHWSWNACTHHYSVISRG